MASPKPSFGHRIMFRVLNADDDCDEWDALIARLPGTVRDVHLTSSYARTQRTMGGAALLAVEEFANDELLVQPFIMRRIDGTDFHDIRSMYQYGGPLSNVGSWPSAPRLGRIFREGLASWARGIGVVSEYCMLNPLYAHQQLPLVRDDDIEFNKNVVCIDNLSGFESSVSRRVKRGVKKATDAGCFVIEAEAPEVFFELYDKSMDRLGAETRWKFTLPYWFSHGREIGTRWFFAVEPVSARFRRALLTVGVGPIAYAHFLGSDGEMLNAGMDDLIYFRAAQHLAREGFSRLHLGGGTTEEFDDPLLRFKTSFSDALYAVGTYRRVFHPEIYNTLSANHAAREREKFGRVSESGWFPAYRREFA